MPTAVGQTSMLSRGCDLVGAVLKNNFNKSRLKMPENWELHDHLKRSSLRSLKFVCGFNGPGKGAITSSNTINKITSTLDSRKPLSALVGSIL